MPRRAYVPDIYTIFLGRPLGMDTNYLARDAGVTTDRHAWQSISQSNTWFLSNKKGSSPPLPILSRVSEADAVRWVVEGVIPVVVKGEP